MRSVRTAPSRRRTLSYPPAVGSALIALCTMMLVGCAGFSTVTQSPPVTAALPATSAPAAAGAAAATPTANLTPSAPLSTVTLAPTGSFQGYHERNTCTVIGGWAYDGARPDTPLNVEIFDGSMLLATVPANIFRADLRDAGIGNGNHSFTYTPPAQIIDGNVHQILIRIAGTDIGLNGTPMPMTCTK